MSAPRVCIVLTSVSMMPDGKPTGFELQELAGPYYAFKRAGLAVQLASVLGGAAPPDPSSQDKSRATEDVDKFMLDRTAQWEIQSTKRVAELNIQDYDAVFLVGGHGTMWDFDTPAVVRFVESMYAANKMVGAVCHGPAALVPAVKVDGTPLVQGLKMTSFSDKEERSMGTDKIVPYLLERRLRELGAIFEEPAKPMAEKVVVDGMLFTGSNPASATPLAEAMARRMTMAA